ncbi:MAG: transcription antitermination protein NusB [Muribaculaceae bacterium]|nr:transcription antitermination protein NusB [Muribaculaceae bacterium]
MINRVLIRIKVVQTLYSYLLTKSDFTIAGVPEKATRDNLYAYRVYIDLLLLIVKLSGRKLCPGDQALVLTTESGANPFKKSLVAEALSTISEIKEEGVKNAHRLSSMNKAVVALAETLQRQSAVTDFAKKRKIDLEIESNLWRTLLESVILKDEQLKEQFRLAADGDFTNVGFERGVNMVIDTLKSYTESRTSLINARKSLRKSLDQACLLYHALLQLPVALVKMQYDNIEAAKIKYVPTADDLNPNTRFVDNAFVAAIRESAEMESFFKEHPFSWDSEYYLLKTLLDKIMASKAYSDYMAKTETSFEEDAEFWRDLFKQVIFTSDALDEALEGISVYWNDDLSTIGTFVLKTIRRSAISPSHQLLLLPQFKDEEDEKFGEKLFTDTLNGFKEYRNLIDQCIDESNWDPERIAFMDTIIIATALAEIMNFPTIPLVVSINEYVEIANYYSSPRSGQFVNGVLYAIASRLQNEHLLHKTFDKPEKTDKSN